MSQPIAIPTRRQLIKSSGLSVAAFGLLMGSSKLAMAASKAPSEGDIAILNVALGLEHEAIAAYQIGAESGLLKGGVLDVAVLFQSHHKAHREAQIATIEHLGGKPVAAKTMDEYMKSSKLNVAAIKTDKDVLKLAQRLELGAVNAYIGVMPSFTDRELSKVAARLLADETMHYTALTQALGEPLPKPGLSFGA